MRHYSEDTVRKIIRSVAHTALEQMDNFIDSTLANQPSIELPDRHGRLIDAEEAIDYWDAEMMVIDKYSMHQFLNRIPTVLEAANG